MKGFLDLLTVKFLTGFGHRPALLLGGIGLVSFLAGNIGLLYLAITWIFRLWEFGREWFPLALHERPMLIYALCAVLLGAQMITMGFLAELITAYTGHEVDSYSIAERTDKTSP